MSSGPTSTSGDSAQLTKVSASDGTAAAATETSSDYKKLFSAWLKKNGEKSDKELSTRWRKDSSASNDSNQSLWGEPGSVVPRDDEPGFLETTVHSATSGADTGVGANV